MSIPAGSIGLPASPTFLVGLKVSGFWLHMIFMNLWLAGLPLALLLRRTRPAVSRRLFGAMPFFMAFGINAGIVPLLFIQVLYPEGFYTATILQAWFWFAIIPLLLVAYSAVYTASSGWYRTLSAGVAFVLLTAIGLMFSSSLSLSASPGEWSGAFERTATAGAVHGTHLLLAPEVLLRYGIVIFLAVITLGAYLALDARWFSSGDDVRTQTSGLPGILAVTGALGFLVVGGLYRGYLPTGFTGFLPSLAAGGLPALAALGGLVYEALPSRTSAALFAGTQALALLANAIVRQLVQIEKLGGWDRLRSLPVHGTGSGVLLFLVTVGIGGVVLLWLIALLRSEST